MTWAAYIGDMLYAHRNWLILIGIVVVLAARIAYLVRQPEGHGLPKGKRRQLEAIKSMRDDGTITEEDYRQRRIELLEK